MVTAYDYSARAIPPADLIAADVRTVMRYVSTDGNPKNITRAEYAALTGAGIAVGLYDETSAEWMLGGYDAGLAAARSARAQATAVGYPSWHRIWYAADFPAAASQIDTIVDCLHGCSDAEGSKDLVAAYGDFGVCTAAVAAGFDSPSQTDAWSSGRWCTAAVLRQTGEQKTCGGVQVDVNELVGQLFLLPAPEPAPTTIPQPEEDDMSTTSVNGRAGLSWPQGSRHVVQVTYDPNLGNPALRVVLALTTGPWVAPEWKPTNGSGTYEIPVEHRAGCRGVILEGAATPVYDAVAA